jgi:hypothetical protein
MNTTMLDQLKAARRVSTPLVAVSTPDPAETVRKVREAFEDGAKTPIPLVQWDAMNGLSAINAAGRAALAKALKSDDASEWPGLTANPGAALAVMADMPGQLGGLPGQPPEIQQRGSIIFMLNAHRFFEDRAGVQNAQVLQGIWNLRDPFKGNRRTLIIVGPAFTFPPEIAQDVILLDEPYPTDAELERVVRQQLADAGAPEPGEKIVEQAVDAVRGLAAFTAEQVVAMSLTKSGLDVDALWRRKIAVVEQTPGLSVDRGAESFDDVRGLENFREFGMALISGRRSPGLFVRIDEIEKSFGGLGSRGGPGDNTGTTQDRLGVMLRTMEDEGWTGFIALGHAGTGKSLVTKALANTATRVSGRRVLSVALDLGETTGGIVGESERKIRAAMKVIKSLAPGGRVCVVATCNDLEVLPPALKRRFKLGVWMFDLPDVDERRAMWELNIKRYGLPPAAWATMPDDEDWTGADIRNVCETADRLECSLEKACQYTTFIAKSDPEAIARLRRLADGKLVSASRPGTYRAPFTAVPFGGQGAQSASRRAVGEE